MPYSVSRQNDPKYGNVIIISIDNDGEFETPFQAVNKLRNIKRLWKNEDPKTKIRYLIDGQILTLSQTETWSNNEYKELPKCESCAKILREQVFTHALCGKNLFCSQACADKNYKFITDLQEEEEEYECL